MDAKHTLEVPTSQYLMGHRDKLSRDGMLHMMFKLGQCAEKKWRRLRGFDYLTKVIIGVKFKDGVEVTEIDLVAA